MANDIDRLRYWRTRRCWRIRLPKPEGGYQVKLFGATGVSENDKAAYAQAILECRAWLDSRQIDLDKREHASAMSKAQTQERAALRLLGNAASGYKSGTMTRDEARVQARQGVELDDKASEELQRLRQPQLRLLKKIDELEPKARQAELLAAEAERLRAENEQLRAIVAATGRAAATEVGELAELVEQFIRAKSAELAAKGRQAKTMTPIRSSSRYLVEWLADYSPAIKTSADLDGCPRALADYRDSIFEQLGERSSGWARKHLDSPRQFVEWMTKRSYLSALPRSIGRDWLAVGKDEPNPTFLTPAEIETLIVEAESDEILLAVLLGLNCGYRESDIISLRASDIDLEAGEIRRTRNKTGALQCHRLWSPTTELLRPWAESGEEYPLAEFNRISLSLTSYMDEVLPGNSELPYGERRTAKSLRSTAAQLVEQVTGGEAPHLVSQMLGHADHSMSKHYRRANFAALYAVIDQISELLEVENIIEFV